MSAEIFSLTYCSAVCTVAMSRDTVTHSTAAPIALVKANSTPEVTRPALGRGYAVQVTSERSEIRAQDAFRALQTKYPNQLRGRQAMIRRADLGAMASTIGPL